MTTKARQQVEGPVEPAATRGLLRGSNESMGDGAPSLARLKPDPHSGTDAIPDGEKREAATADEETTRVGRPESGDGSPHRRRAETAAVDRHDPSGPTDPGATVGSSGQAGGRARLMGAAVVLGSAIAFLAMYVALHPFIGDIASILAVVPVVAAARAYGVRGGVLAAALAAPVHMLLDGGLAGDLGHLVSGPAFWMGHAALMLVAISLGHTWTAQARLGRALATREQAQAELRESEDRNRSLYECAPAAYFSVGADGLVKDCNKHAVRMLGRARVEIVGNPVLELYADMPDGRPEAAKALQRFLSGEPLRDQELRMQRADGTLIWISLSVNAQRDGDGQIVASHAIVVDITERKRTERDLVMHARRQRVIAELGQATLQHVGLQSLADRAAALVAEALDVAHCAVLERVPHERGLLVRAGTGWRAGVVGSTRVSVDGSPYGDGASAWGQSLRVDDIRSDRRFHQAELLHEHGIRSVGTAVISGHRQPYGALAVFSTQVRAFRSDELDFLRSVAHVLATAAEHGRKDAVIEHLAFNDALTGLPNRRLLTDRLRMALAQALRHGDSVSVLFLDLDGFKLVNDRMGHEVGDEVLMEMGRRLVACLRDTDTVARMSGDEFVMVLPNPGGHQAVIRTAERVLNAAAKIFNVDGNEIRLTGSLGISTYPSDGEDPATLLRNADSSMYSAKAGGRDRYVMYDSEWADQPRGGLALVADIRQALDRGELLAHYQPQIDLSTGAIAGFEALVRWQRPDGELLSAGQFIPMTEGFGLISRIDRWMLGTACRQAKAWQVAGLPPVRMAVNISVGTLQEPGFVEAVRQVLEQTGIDPRLLELEITERVALEPNKHPERVLRQLQDLGVRLALDDFGTGYASLAMLKQFSLDAIKIDASFVRDLMTNDLSHKVITSSMVQLGRALGLEVIAEGVETDQQVAVVRDLGCDLAQGWAFGRRCPPKMRPQHWPARARVHWPAESAT